MASMGYGLRWLRGFLVNVPKSNLQALISKVGLFSTSSFEFTGLGRHEGAGFLCFHIDAKRALERLNGKQIGDRAVKIHVVNYGPRPS